MHKSAYTALPAIRPIIQHYSIYPGMYIVHCTSNVEEGLFEKDGSLDMSRHVMGNGLSLQSHALLLG